MDAMRVIFQGCMSFVLHLCGHILNLKWRVLSPGACLQKPLLVFFPNASHRSGSKTHELAPAPFARLRVRSFGSKRGALWKPGAWKPEL